MVDADFLTARSGSLSQTVEFSHTDSRTEARLWNAELAIGGRVADLGNNVRALLLGGFRFQSQSYDIYGATGWPLDENSNRVNFTLSDDLLALRYRTWYGVPFLGVRVDGALSPALSFLADLRALGSYSSHDDDHVLRNKSGTSTPFGLGFELGGALLVKVTDSFYLGADLRFQYLHSVGGRLSQKYYGDDPSIAGDQTQTTVPDTNFTFEYLRARGLAFVEARF